MSGEWPRGDWMQTASGGRFYPLDPQPSEIDPDDIAHALSLLCRYGGHVDRFYSVAEHCVLMSQAVAPEHALAALLHDATEAYVVDVPRPLKRQLAGYVAIEDGVWNAICQKFRIAADLPESVKDADNRILLTERTALMPRAERWSQDDEYSPLPVAIQGWSPPVAERAYADRLSELLSARLPAAEGGRGMSEQAFDSDNEAIVSAIEGNQIVQMVAPNGVATADEERSA